MARIKTQTDFAAYTVLLLRPEYICDDPSDAVNSTYLAHVGATDPKMAVAYARQEAADADGQDDKPDGIDYVPLFVTKGIHRDVKPN